MNHQSKRQESKHHLSPAGLVEIEFEEAIISTTWYRPSPGPAFKSSSSVCIPVGQLIQKGADKDGVGLTTFIRLSLNSQKTLPLKK